MQEESEFRLWVYVEDTPTDTLIPRTNFVSTARGYLSEAGFPDDAPYVSIGHSMGGKSVTEEVILHLRIHRISLSRAEENPG